MHRYVLGVPGELSAPLLTSPMFLSIAAITETCMETHCGSKSVSQLQQEIQAGNLQEAMHT